MLKKILPYLSIKYLLVYSWLGAIIIYFARSLFGFGSAITVLAQFWADAVGVICFVGYIYDTELLNKYVRKILTCIVAILCLAVVYFFLFDKSAPMYNEMLGETATSYDRLKLLMYSLLAFIPASYFAGKKLLPRPILICAFFILWCLSIVLFYDQYDIISTKYGSNIIVNNYGYLVLSLLPLSLLLNPPVRFVYLASCVLFSFMSAKRGAAMEAVIFVSLITLISVKNARLINKLLLLLLILCLAYYVLYYHKEDLVPILMRFDRDGVDSYSRTLIINSIIDGFLSGNLVECLLGYGPLGSVLFAGNYAHNDFLEFMCDYGVVGFILLCLLYINAIKAYQEKKHIDIVEVKILLIVIGVCLFKSFFSMNLFDASGPIHMIAMGYSLSILGNNELNE